MKNNQNTEQNFNYLLLSAVFIVFLALALILIPVLLHKEVGPVNSDVPVFNTQAADRLNGIYEDRTDIDTDGKPDINKFTIGNPEPFK